MAEFLMLALLIGFYVGFYKAEKSKKPENLFKKGEKKNEK